MKLILAFSVAAAAIAQDPGPHRDKTGVAWVLPYSEATAKAKRTGRLLLVKPIAGGTTADGCW